MTYDEMVPFARKLVEALKPKLKGKFNPPVPLLDLPKADRHNQDFWFRSSVGFREVYRGGYDSGIDAIRIRSNGRVTVTMPSRCGVPPFTIQTTPGQEDDDVARLVVKILERARKVKAMLKATDDARRRRVAEEDRLALVVKGQEPTLHRVLGGTIVTGERMGLVKLEMREEQFLKLCGILEKET